jgi:HEAT repeat protein
VNSRDLESVLRKIEKIRLGNPQELSWLLPLLEADNGAIRCAAISAIERIDQVRSCHPKLLNILDHDTDVDVVTRVISTLSANSVGSRQADLILRMTRAASRFPTGYAGLDEALEDAKLRIVQGLSTVSIVKLQESERQELLALVDEVIQRGSQS